MSTKITPRSTLVELMFYFPSIFSKSDLEIIPEEISSDQIFDNEIKHLPSYEEMFGESLIFLCRKCGNILKETNLYSKRKCFECTTRK